MMYLPGIAFLFIVSTVIAIPFLLFIKNKPLAIFLSACISTLILKVWAYFAIGGFDLGFLIIQIMISLCAAGTTSFMMDRIGNSKVKAT